MIWTDLQTALAGEGYVASDDLAVALHLALTLGRPLYLKGRQVSARQMFHARWQPPAVPT
jgi:hypothetical protein